MSIQTIPQHSPLADLGDNLNANVQNGMGLLLRIAIKRQDDLKREQLKELNRRETAYKELYKDQLLANNKKAKDIEMAIPAVHRLVNAKTSNRSRLLLDKGLIYKAYEHLFPNTAEGKKLAANYVNTLSQDEYRADGRMLRRLLGPLQETSDYYKGYRKSYEHGLKTRNYDHDVYAGAEEYADAAKQERDLHRELQLLNKQELPSPQAPPEPPPEPPPAQSPFVPQERYGGYGRKHIESGNAYEAFGENPEKYGFLSGTLLDEKRRQEGTYSTYGETPWGKIPSKILRRAAEKNLPQGSGNFPFARGPVLGEAYQALLEKMGMTEEEARKSRKSARDISALWQLATLLGTRPGPGPDRRPDVEILPKLPPPPPNQIGHGQPRVGGPGGQKLLGGPGAPDIPPYAHSIWPPPPPPPPPAAAPRPGPKPKSPKGGAGVPMKRPPTNVGPKSPKGGAGELVRRPETTVEPSPIQPERGRGAPTKEKERGAILHSLLGPSLARWEPTGLLKPFLRPAKKENIPDEEVFFDLPRQVHDDKNLGKFLSVSEHTISKGFYQRLPGYHQKTLYRGIIAALGAGLPAAAELYEKSKGSLVESKKEVKRIYADVAAEIDAVPGRVRVPPEDLANLANASAILEPVKAGVHPPVDRAGVLGARYTSADVMKWINTLGSGFPEKMNRIIGTLRYVSLSPKQLLLALQKLRDVRKGFSKKGETIHQYVAAKRLEEIIRQTLEKALANSKVPGLAEKYKEANNLYREFHDLETAINVLESWGPNFIEEMIKLINGMGKGAKRDRMARVMIDIFGPYTFEALGKQLKLLHQIMSRWRPTAHFRGLRGGVQISGSLLKLLGNLFTGSAAFVGSAYGGATLGKMLGLGLFWRAVTAGTFGVTGSLVATSLLGLRAFYRYIKTARPTRGKRNRDPILLLLDKMDPNVARMYLKDLEERKKREKGGNGK